ncbi:MAG: translation initiation factor IF-2 [Candidatus Coatesbacteria bacterium]|nr:translation initiation factor IF-2 [Candidatus Coatesbacteria bacterium]
MATTRVYQLAKELNIGSKEILSVLEELGVSVKSHMSGIDDVAVELIREHFLEEEEPEVQKKATKKKADEKEEPKPPKHPPKKPEKPEKKERIPEVKETPPEPVREPVEEKPTPPKKIILEKSLTIDELAQKLRTTSEHLKEALQEEGKEASSSRILDFDTTTRLARRFGAEVEVGEGASDALLKIALETGAFRKNVARRAPVVTIMGHVDHGKTTILDEIRKSKIVEAESGNITQHIGAYYVTTPQGDVVFLDTPGHQAFTAMRARGAHVTDIVVLVVAVDDGIMPQTQEAIRHAQAAGVPIIVALNKMDRAMENVERVKRSFARFGLIPEDEGGDTIFVPTSAIKRQGLDTLIEMILLVAEMADLTAPSKGPAKGLIIETKLDKGRGPVATVLVQAGQLEGGDIFVAGTTTGKVRAMTDDRGRNVKAAGPSRPVEVMGFDSLPDAGEVFSVIPKGRKAKEYLASLAELQREEESRAAPQVRREAILLPLEEEKEENCLNIILKADVFGSLGALSGSLMKLATEEVKIEIIHSGVGSVSKADVSLAEIAQAEIIGFGIKVDSAIAAFAKQQDVQIKVFDIIYSLLDHVEMVIKKMAKPTLVEEELGTAEIRAVFSVPNIGKVAGCFVLTGRMVRDGKARLLRGGEEIYTGRMASLKRFKKDVKEVQTNFDCGIGLHGFQDYEVGDVIHCYHLVEETAG